MNHPGLNPWIKGLSPAAGGSWQGKIVFGDGDKLEEKRR